MTAEIVVLHPRRAPSPSLVASSDPVAAWRTPSGMLLPAAAVVGAPHPDLTPVLGSAPATALPHAPLPGRHPAADVWSDRVPPLRAPVSPADLRPTTAPSWWSAWLASFRERPHVHLFVFAGVALASTLALIGAGAL